MENKQAHQIGAAFPLPSRRANGLRVEQRAPVDGIGVQPDELPLHDVVVELVGPEEGIGPRDLVGLVE